LIKYPDFSNVLLLTFSLVIFAVVVVLAISSKNSAEKSKLVAFVVLYLALLAYGILYMIGPIMLFYFIENNVRLSIGGFHLATPWFQNINSIIVIFGGPAIAWLLQKARLRGIKTFTIGFLFSTGIFFTGAGFFALFAGIHFASATGLVNPWIVALSYVLQTVGELLTAPIGYVMVGVLVPARWQSFMMGVVMMSYGTSSVIATYFSGYILPLGAVVDPLLTNAAYAGGYLQVTLFATVSAVVIFALLPWLNKKSGEIL